MGTPNGAREGTKRAHWALTSAKEDFWKSFSDQQGRLGLIPDFPRLILQNKLAWTGHLNICQLQICQMYPWGLGSGTATKTIWATHILSIIFTDLMIA